MARPVDAEALEKKISEWLGQPGNGDYYSGYDAALCAVQDLIADTPTITPPNEPLTLEQLRGMEDPVWCVCKTVEGFEGFWCLCDHGYILTPARQIFDVKEIPHWGFYRRPPEGEKL